MSQHGRAGPCDALPWCRWGEGAGACEDPAGLRVPAARMLELMQLCLPVSCILLPMHVKRHDSSSDRVRSCVAPYELSRRDMAQYTGFVKSYNESKGWGFIECPQTQAIYGKDIFVLRSALSGGGQGDQVMFNVVDHGRGPQASDVVVLGSARPATPLGAVNGPMNGHGYSQQMQPMPTARSAPMTVYSQPVNQHAGSNMVGTVKSYNAEKGWGFVTSPEVVEMYGKDVFFMKSSVVGGVIERNQQVSFTVVSGTKGMQAEKVCPISPAPAMHRDSAFPAMRAPPPLMIPVVPQMPRMLAPPPSAASAARPAPDQLFFGAVKGYNEEKGWGHISCEAAKAVYGKEVFLLRSTLGGALVEAGTLLAFKVTMAAKGPQACEVTVLPAETFQFEGQPGREFVGTVKLHNTKHTGMHHLVSMASRRVSRLLRPGLRLCPSPGAQRSAPRMLVTDNFGRRPELYDDDTFIPIDEHPASWAVRPQPQPSHVGSTIETVEATRAEEAEPREAEPTAAATATVATAAAATEHSQPAEPLPTPGGVKLQPPAPPPPPRVPEEMPPSEAWQVQKHVGPPCASGRDLSHAGMNLEPVDWSQASSGSLRLFYKEHPAVTSQSREEVQDFLQQNGVQVEGTKELPKPIRSFDHAGFPKPVVEYLTGEFSVPTPIQSVGWPLALSGRDMVGLAQTGSGKTLAYLLPAMLHVKAQPAELGEGPVVLVLAPTRELAMQIQMEAFRVGEILGVRDAVVYGGVSRRGQEQILRKGVDVLIATPGRLLDFLEARVTNLGRVSYLVVDEADRMLDMGFEPQLRRVVSQVRPGRQTVMWSATWPASIRDLAKDFCENMLKVTVGISAAKANPNIRQDIRVVTELDKKKRFFEWLEEVSPAQGAQPRVLVFTETKRAADALCRELRYEQYAAGAIHGDKDQRERDSILYQFRKGRCQILVATDVAQRGLDIKDVAYVVNYSMPKTIEDYVHRIGRTGRAGAHGTAVSFFTCDFGASDKARMARGLVKVIEDAGQEPPEALRMFNAEKRWGFVTSDEITALFSGKDIFLHQNALQDAASLPEVGQQVRFSIEVGESGKLQAKEVILEGVSLLGQDAGFSPVRPGVPSERAAPYYSESNLSAAEALVVAEVRMSISAVPAGYCAGQVMPTTLPVMPGSHCSAPGTYMPAPMPMSFASPGPTMMAGPSGSVAIPMPAQAGPVYAAPVSGSQNDAASPASSDDLDGPYTRGFPDPASIEEQKKAYCRSLDLQLEEGNKSLQQQNIERKKQLHEAAEQQKQALLLHMDQQVKMQEMALDEQTNQAMMGLKKAALDQRPTQ
ncbi:ATP-dependent RNA helicase dbp2 [Symbiodinium microadriaticum]|uniref:RNA helicase n=1 Tax=Symbiodinium microadriaticum TaxID=2951 RepID=A0A1Q9C394_SYMMI|nr:ATP-dependent RNA helicase dbp2 [Symbiodinium microadriaticum]